MNVSIAIRAFRRRWLGDAITSVLQQTHRDLELIVYDDAGDLEDVATGFRDERVRYVRAEKKFEASGRFAAAVALCRGTYIGLLDDDDRYEPPFVERMVHALEAHPRAGAAICRELHDRNGTVIAAPPPPVTNVMRRILAERWSVSPSATLFRRAALEQFALPDGVSPDVFTNFSIAQAGWQHVLVDEVLVTRRVHAEQISRSVTCAKYAVETFARLRVSDPELERLRGHELLRRRIIHWARSLLG